MRRQYKKRSISIFIVSAFQEQLEDLCKMQSKELWRDNAIQLSERYLKEGLQDRAVSRDLPNGVSIPVKGYEEKKIYVWIEAVAGYYSASKQWAKKRERRSSILG